MTTEGAINGSEHGGTGVVGSPCRDERPPPPESSHGSRLLDRDAPLELVWGALAAASAGRGELIVIEGSAGLGKSTLLAAARALAAHAGVTPLCARGRALQLAVPFNVVVELLGHPLSQAAPTELARLLSGPAAAAAEVLDGPRRNGHGKHVLARRVDGLLWLSRRLAASHPLLLCVDDANFADPSSLRVLLALAEQLSDLPVAIVVSVPPRLQAGRPRVLGQLLDHPAARRVTLEPLSRQAVAELAGVTPDRGDDDFVDSAVQATAGNPFLLAELMIDLAVRDLPPTVESVRRLVRSPPATIVRALTARVQQLPRTSERLAAAIAVLGDGVPLGLAAELARVELEQAAAAADALASADVLGPEDLRFAQPLLRSALYAAMPPAHRAVMHLRAARLHARSGASDERVAAHLLAASPTGSAWVVERLCSTAQAALSSGSPASAARLLRRALDEPPADHGRAAVLVPLAEAEAMLGVATCVDRLEQALALVSAPGPHAMIAVRLGAMLAQRGRAQEACALLRGTLDGLGDDDADLAEEVALAYIGVALLDADWAPDARWQLRRRLVTGEPPSRRRRALLVLNQLNDILELRPAPAGAALADEAIAASRDGGDWIASTEPWALISCLVWADELAQAERVSSAVVAAATARGSTVSHAQARAARAPVCYWSGHLVAAIDEAGAACDGGRGIASTWRNEAAAWLCLCHLERDDPEAAAEVLQELGDAGAHDVQGPGALLLAIARGRLALEENGGERALELLVSAGHRLGPVTRNPAVLPWRSEAAMAAAWLGDQGYARALATEEVTLTRRFGARRSIGVALRAAGLVAGGAEGLELLRESVHVLECSPATLERARALAALGGELRRQGHRRAARDVLRSGLALAERCGARRLERGLRDELAAAGARPRRRDASGPGALTPGEQRVAHLAARGLTNRQIARELFVTDKAVQWHLRHVYRKLGVSHRQDLPESLRQ